MKNRCFVVEIYVKCLNQLRLKLGQMTLLPTVLVVNKKRPSRSHIRLGRSRRGGGKG